jgi:phosphatidylglycerophosphate synthase
VSTSPDLSARRPLKSRSAAWASGLSKALLKSGISPNQVSVASSLFAILAAVFMVKGSEWIGHTAAWILSAICIQLRLVCNLMDGMLAVEGGRKTANGDLYNEFPDRISDMVILAAMGHAGGSLPCIVLGWVAACGALMTACVRMHGASLLGTHDFRGPMAKPQRMALATAVCVLMAVWPIAAIIQWSLVLTVIGITFTVMRRLAALSTALSQRRP